MNKGLHAKVHLVDNVTYELRDKNGKIKQLFTENKLGQGLLKFFRSLAPEPVNQKTGQIKPGILNFLSANGVQIPYVTGNFGDFRQISNLITNAGAAGVASRINGAGSEAAFTYIAVGTGATAANVADTTLQTELATSGLSRAAATASRVTTDVTNDTARNAVTFTVSGTAAVVESGVLNAGSGGTLLNRQTFSALNVVNGDSLTITHNFDVD